MKHLTPNNIDAFIDFLVEKEGKYYSAHHKYDAPSPQIIATAKQILGYVGENRSEVLQYISAIISFDGSMAFDIEPLAVEGEQFKSSDFFELEVYNTGYACAYYTGIDGEHETQKIKPYEGQEDNEIILGMIDKYISHTPLLEKANHDVD